MVLLIHVVGYDVHQVERALTDLNDLDSHVNEVENVLKQSKVSGKNVRGIKRVTKPNVVSFLSSQFLRDKEGQKME